MKKFINITIAISLWAGFLNVSLAEVSSEALSTVKDFAEWRRDLESVSSKSKDDMSILTYGAKLAKKGMKLQGETPEQTSAAQSIVLGKVIFSMNEFSTRLDENINQMKAVLQRHRPLAKSAMKSLNNKSKHKMTLTQHTNKVLKVGRMFSHSLNGDSTDLERKQSAIAQKIALIKVKKSQMLKARLGGTSYEENIINAGDAVFYNIIAMQSLLNTVKDVTSAQEAIALARITYTDMNIIDDTADQIDSLIDQLSAFTAPVNDDSFDFDLTNLSEQYQEIEGE